MADEVKAAPAVAPAPVAAPAPAPTANQKISGRSSLITNPTPVVDLEAPVVAAPINRDDFSSSTLAEMDAGRAALERGKKKPVAPVAPVAPAVARPAGT